MSWDRAGCLQLETGGTAFFISDRLAVTARSCVPGHWRTRPEIALLDPASQAWIPTRVVAENQDRAIALVDDAVDVNDIDDARARRQLEAAQAELEAIERGDSSADRWQIEQRLVHAENMLGVAGRT